MKFISLNIERDLHYERVFPFLRREEPIGTCLLEVLDRDVPRFEEVLGKAVYAPIAVADKGRDTERLAKEGVRTGQSIFTSLPVEESGTANYCGCSDNA